MLAIVNEMVKTGRLKYVAKMARDLVVGVQEQCSKMNGPCLRKLSQVDVSGFSFGT